MKARDFKIRAVKARAWASRWAAQMSDVDQTERLLWPGAGSPRLAHDMAVEWHARAELAEAYAKRAAEVAS